MSYTTVTIIGEQPVVKKYNKIKFIAVLDGNGKMISSAWDIPQPDSFLNIELICRKYTVNEPEDKRKDLMFAYDHDRSSGMLYLGYFNDGVVE